MGLFPHSHAPHRKEGRYLVYLFSNSLVHYGNRYKWFYVQCLFLVMANTYIWLPQMQDISQADTARVVKMSVYSFTNLVT